MLSNGSVLSSDETLIIGKSRYGMEFDGYTANFYNGFIDEIKLYCHCLNTAEVNALASLATSHQFLSNNELWNDYSLLASDRYAPQYHMRHPLAGATSFMVGFILMVNTMFFSTQSLPRLLPTRTTMGPPR